MARLVIPGLPHHVTQRGNGRARTFFNDDDDALYRALLAENCTAAGVEAWAWVLMPNHVHLILTPSDEDGLRQALAATHRRYAGHIHAREKRTGHFWQERFGCVAMDEAHLAAAIVYVAPNPVRPKLVEHAEKWRWSSTPAHLGSVAEDGLTTVAPVMERFPDLEARLAAGEDEMLSARLRKAEQIGRPLGSAAFIADLERRTRRRLTPARPGRKPVVKDG
jgi:putative transposase